MGESVPAAPGDGSLGSGRLPRAQLQRAIQFLKEVAHERFVAARTGEAQVEKTTRAKERHDVRGTGTSGIILGRRDDG